MVSKRLGLRWSRQALEQLCEGLGYIAMFNPQAARSIRIAIADALEQVRLFPESARMVPEQVDPRIREVLREPFRIIYEIQSRELRILAVRRMERAPLEADDLSQG